MDKQSTERLNIEETRIRLKQLLNPISMYFCLADLILKDITYQSLEVIIKEQEEIRYIGQKNLNQILKILKDDDLWVI